jgi:hypothetical protein
VAGSGERDVEPSGSGATEVVSHDSDHSVCVSYRDFMRALALQD